MASNTVRVMLTARDEVSGPLDRIRDKFEMLGKSKGAQSILQGVGLGVGVSAFGMLERGIGAATDAMKESITAASAMNETVSKAGVVFGSEAPRVMAWGQTAATSMGMAKQTALEAAATLGNLFVSMDLGAKASADMSTKMVGLASDLASFNNSSPEDALEALRAGLVGETEPLRRFGINLNDAQLRQEALDLGLVDSTKNVLPAAVRAQAAYSLILKQSATAQGDFGRTSGGLANQQRILDAQMKDLSADFGTVLLPAMIQLVTFLNNNVIPALRDLGAGLDLVFGNLREKTAFDSFKSQVSGLTNNELVAMRAEFQKTFDEIAGQKWPWDRTANWGKADVLQGQMKAIDAVIADNLDETWRDSRAPVQAIADALPDALEKADRKVQQTVASGFRGLLQKYADTRAVLQGDADALAKALYDPVETGLQIAVIKAELGSKDLADKLKSRDPEIVANAQLRRAQLQQELIGLTIDQTTYGDQAAQIAATKALLTSSNWAAWARNATPEQAAAIAVLKADLEARLAALTAEAWHYGDNFTSNYITGLRAKLAQLGATAAEIASAVWKYTHIASPAEAGPLSRDGGPEGWGRRLGQLYAKGIASGFGTGDMSDALSGLAAGSRSTRAGAGGGGAQVIQLVVDSRVLAEVVNAPLANSMRLGAVRR